MDYHLRSDLQTLLNRALKGKEVTIFGEDGNGRFARFSFPLTAAICQLEILNSSTDERAHVALQIHEGTRFLVKGDCLTETHGRPDGDQNLKLSLNMLLRDVNIPSDAWKFTYANIPGADVVLEFDVAESLVGS